MIKFFTPLLLAIALNGCAIKLISNYDQKTDDEITAVHRKLINGLSLQPIPDAAGVDPAMVEFYKSVENDLHQIRVRAMAIDKNELTVKQIEAAAKAVDAIQSLDKIGFSQDTRTLATRNWDTICGSILKLELAKKRN